MWQKILPFLVAIAIVIGGILLYRNRHQLFRPNVDKLGGTLLVLAVDGDPPHEGLADAVKVLQRRFDSTGELGITVRAANEREIEVLVPRTDNHDELVARVQALIARPGKLEFRILANEEDDKEVCQAVRQKPPKLDEKLPDPPRNELGEPDFPSELPGRPVHRYAWARLTPPLMKVARLDAKRLGPAEEEGPAEMRLATTGEPFAPLGVPMCLAVARKEAGGVVFYMLTREVAAELRVTSQHVESVQTERGRGGALLTMAINLTREGGQRLTALTAANTRMRHDQPRYLGTVIDDELVTIPSLFGVISRKVHINAPFEPDEAESVVGLIRGGVLSVRLKPSPVRVSPIEPRK